MWFTAYIMYVNHGHILVIMPKSEFELGIGHLHHEVHSLAQSWKPAKAGL